MPRIFGHELTTKQLWIGGGLAAVGVAAVVYMRSRGGVATEAPAAGGDYSGDAMGGGPVSVGAPTSAAADAYQSQLASGEQEAQSIANAYQKQLMRQQETAFNFQQRQMEALAPDLLERERSALAVETHYNKTVAKKRIACPGGNQAVYQTVTGELACREKTSGGFLGIPLGAIGRSVAGFFEGVQAASPEIGYNTAKQAAQYYTGKTFSQNSYPGQVKRTTPPISPTSVKITPDETVGKASMAPHGYGMLSI